MSDAEALRRRGHAAKKRVQFTPEEENQAILAHGASAPSDLEEGVDYEKNY